MGRVFANGPGDLGSIPGRVIPKTLKMVLDTSLLNTHQYKVRIEGKVQQSRERSSATPTPRCSSYWKGSLLVALDYGRRFTIIIIFFHINVSWWSSTGDWATAGPQVSRTLLSILTVLNNAVVWMVSTRPPNSKSSGPFNNPLVTVPWSNGYRRRKWTRRHEFKSWTRLIAFHIALIALGKVWIQLFSLHLWVNSRAD